MSHRKTATAMLALLAPFTAEFLLGDQYLFGGPTLRQIGPFAMFVVFYGGGAILIREVTRRTGHGWPTMLLLALAFGIAEEGLLTQSLFNPNYVNAHLLDAGFISSLGIAGPWTVYVLTLHLVWSMATPIALTEALFGREPWLRRTGVGVWAALFGLGCAATFGFSLAMGHHFMAAPAQLGTVAAITVGLVVLALRRVPENTSIPPSLDSRAAFALGLVSTTTFQLLMGAGWIGSAWLLTALLLGVELVTWLTIARARPAAFPLAAGAALTYCWMGLRTALQSGAGAVIEQCVLVLIMLALLAFLTMRTTRDSVMPGLRFGSARR